MRERLKILGIELDEVSLKERLLSGLGGTLAILCVLLVSEQALGLTGATMVVASMGASAVLLFAVPHGQLSQPWPVAGGQLLSALIGVTCARVVDQRTVAAALAVGLAITAMHLGRCIHPPGGATALSAVLGGPAVADLGYSYVARPVLLNVCCLLVVAVLFNALLPWRRYPAALQPRPAMRHPADAPTHDEVVAALRSLDSFVDITEDDLVRLVDLLSHQPAEPPRPAGAADARVPQAPGM